MKTNKGLINFIRDQSKAPPQKGTSPSWTQGLTDGMMQQLFKYKSSGPLHVELGEDGLMYLLTESGAIHGIMSKETFQELLK